MVHITSILVAALATTVAFVNGSSPLPAGYNPYNPDDNLRPYHPPTGQDSRGPCPMLNSLANHGYINHDGRDIKKQDLLAALHDHVGIAHSAVEVAMANALILCNFITGEDCGTTLKNLTILALPHAFEHDHSFSRQDYKMNYLEDPTEHSDNYNFNASIFQESLDVVKGFSHMNTQQMNEVRLQRESNSQQTDFEGWFIEQKPIQEFEAAFIFAAMSDFNLREYFTNPQVRVEWWQYWFENEKLPYELGWHRPYPPKDIDFVLSVSSKILHERVVSTPTPLPSGAIGPGEEALPLLKNVANTTYPLPTFTPYRGPMAGNLSQTVARARSRGFTNREDSRSGD